ncbi:hypothetical protein WDU94_010990 [Cyamophila willieti]
MSKGKVVLASAIFLFMHMLSENELHQLPHPVRRWWTTKLFKKRSNLVLELKEQALSGQYRHFTRMSPFDFENLLKMIGGQISKVNTKMRAAISAQDRLETQNNIHNTKLIECSLRCSETRPHLCNTSVSNIKEDHQKTDNIMDPRRAFGEHSLECFYPVHTSQF